MPRSCHGPAEVAEGGGHRLAGHRPPGLRGVLQGQPQGHGGAAVALRGTQRDRLFAEGSQQTQLPAPGAVFAQSRSSAPASTANVGDDCVSSCRCWGGKNKS